MKENEIDEGRVSAQRAEDQQITPPPHIRQNEASDASESNAQKYLRRKFGDFPVQWLPLGEVAEFYGGLTGKNKHDFENGNSKYVTYKNIYSNIEIDNNAFEYVDIHPNEKQNKIKYGDILVTGSSENLEEAGMTSAVTCEVKEDIYLNSFSFGIRFNENINLIPEFAKYLFRCDYMRNSIKKTASGVTRYNVSKTRFKKLLIPIPPMEVQNEVVEILDKFSNLTAELQKELKAELKARKLQYEYYRDQLLSFPDDDPNVQWLPLGEVAEIGTGSSNRQDEVEDGKYPFYVRSKNVLRSATFQFDEIAIIIPGEGGIGEIFHYVEGKYALHQRAYRISVHNSNLSTRFLYFYMTSHFKGYIINKSVGATATSIRKPMLENFIIPIPPMEEQERIVGILDKFDTLTNSLTEGIPKEIEMRQMQYEYYRDALLSF